jgi:hypothetical protein
VSRPDTPTLRTGSVLAIVLATYTTIVLDISIVITAAADPPDAGLLGDRAVVGAERRHDHGRQRAVTWWR